MCIRSSRAEAALEPLAAAWSTPEALRMIGRPHGTLTEKEPAASAGGPGNGVGWRGGRAHEHLLYNLPALGDKVTLLIPLCGPQQTRRSCTWRLPARASSEACRQLIKISGVGSRAPHLGVLSGMSAG